MPDSSSPAAATAPAPKRSSCLGRVAKLSLVLLVLLAVLVGFLPKILSSGPGTRFVERLAAPSINGTLAIQDLDLSWGGGQKVTGLRIDDSTGRNVALLDVTVGNGLIALARGEWKRIDLALGGALAVEILPDGSTNLATLAKASAAKPAPGPAASTPATPAAPAPPRLPAGLDARIAIAGLDVTLTEQATKRTVKLTDLTGRAVASTVQPIVVKLDGGSEFEGRKGSIKVDATLTDLARPDGTIALAAASADVVATLTNVALPLPQMLIEVKSLDATVKSADLTRQIAVKVESAATLNGNTPSAASATIVANELLRPDGTLAFRPENVVADITASNLPTAVLEPFLRGQPLVAARDIGPTADATIHFPGGGGDVTVGVKAANLALDATGSIDAASGIVVVNRLTATTSVQPALLEALTEFTSPRPIAVTAESGRIVVPHAASTGAIVIPDVSIESLAIRLPGSVELSRRVPAAAGATGGATTTEALGTAQDLALTVKSAKLRERIDVTASGIVEGGTLAVDQRIEKLFAADGQIDAAGATAAGTIALSGIAPQRILGLLPPDQAAIAREALTGPIDARMTTSVGAERQAVVTLSSGALRLDADAALKGRSLAVKSAKVTAPVTPGLLAALQRSSAKPIQATPTTLTAILQPLVLDLDALGDFMVKGPTVVADLTLGDTSFTNVPGTATAVGLAGFAGKATITPGTPLAIAFDGGARAAAGPSPLATLALKVNATKPAGDVPLALTGAVDATALQVAAVESLLGRPTGSLSNLLGTSGTLSVRATPRPDGAIDATITPTFETMKGTLESRVAGDIVSVGSGRFELMLTAAQLDALLEPTPNPGAPAGRAAAAGEPPALRFAAPTTVVATLADTVVTLGALSGEPFDPTKVRTTIDIKTTPLAMTLGSGQRIDFDGLTAKVATPRIDQGVTFELKGASAGGGAGGAALTVSGTARNLVDASSRLQPGNAALDLDATLAKLPTALLDRLRNLDGLLITALGELLDGRVQARGLSKQAGTVTANLSAANGKIDVPLATLRDGLLVIEPGKPITGELAITKPLRDRLLYKVNPILADIRQTQQPIKLTIPTFGYPLDGNLARLDGQIQFTFGEVAFDAGSNLLSFLEIFNKNQAPTIPGFVEPLNIAIAKGQLLYKDFALRVGKDSAGWKHALVFSGDIDLAQQPPVARAIRTMYPADGLSRSIKELKDIPVLSAVSVGFTFFGPLYDAAGNAKALSFKVDFELKPEQVLQDPKIQEQIGKGLDSLFKKLDKKK